MNEKAGELYKTSQCLYLIIENSISSQNKIRVICNGTDITILPKLGITYSISKTQWFRYGFKKV